MTTLYPGLDVSLELTSVCVVDEEGRIIRETKVASEPDAINRELRSTLGDYLGVGLCLHFGENFPASAKRLTKNSAIVASFSKLTTSRPFQRAGVFDSRNDLQQASKPSRQNRLSITTVLPSSFSTDQ